MTNQLIENFPITILQISDSQIKKLIKICHFN